MYDIKNILEVINEIVVIPLAIIAFVLLMYIVLYLRKKDPDVIRAKIFLKYVEFKKAFVLIAVFAFVLIMHVSFIYIPRFFSFGDSLIGDIQKIFGLFLVLILITFVYFIFRIIK